MTTSRTRRLFVGETAGRRMRRKLVTGAVAGVLAMGASPDGFIGVARAQASAAQRKGHAEMLFDEGRELLARGQVEAACERFEQSQAIDPGIGTLGRLGACYQQLGKIFSAWAIFKEVASKAREAGQPERAREAEVRVRELQALLPRITVVEPPNPPRGLELILDGETLDTALLGIPFSVDPGDHRLIARAPGHETWVEDIAVEGNGAHRKVEVPALGRLRQESAADRTEEQTRASAPQAPAPLIGPRAKLEEPSHEPPAPAARPATFVYVLGAAGLGALGVGAVFGMVASSKDSEALDNYCTADGCYDTKGAELNTSARRWATAANISYIAGAATLGTALVLFLLEPGNPSTNPTSRLEWAPVLGRGTGLQVTRRF